MNFELFQQVTLTHDIPEKSLRCGDVATIVEHHPIVNGEDGYSLEIFNAVGDTIAVLTVPESYIRLLSSDSVFTIRELVAV